jgi:hypothetical protein
VMSQWVLCSMSSGVVSNSNSKIGDSTSGRVADESALASIPSMIPR